MTNRRDISDVLRMALGPIRDSFVASIPERVTNIDAGLDKIASGGDMQTALETLRVEMHKIAGSAGSIGFEVLGECSAAAEHLLRELPNVGPETSAADASVDAALRRIDDTRSQLVTIAYDEGS